MKHRSFFAIVVLALAAIGAAVAQVSSTDQTMPIKVFGSEINLFGPPQAEFDQNMKEVLFDFDTHETTTDEAVLRSNVQWLKDHPQARFYIEGYTDHRGNIAYNLSLAQRRAEAVRAELLNRGVPADRILLTVGWGELYPPCDEQTESCWERSRRVRFVYAPTS
jgi:outer membrane protein OmpA-like peptidoglycan-associated protein